MSNLPLASTTVHLALTDAPEVTNRDGRAFTPAVAVWTAAHYDWQQPAEVYRTASLYQAVGDPTGSAAVRWFEDEEVPAWVPRPPEGWDAGVIACAGSAVAS